MSVGTKKTGKLAVTVSARQHSLTSDTAAGTGGEDLGPNPHELVEAALAACTAITIEMYAARHALKLTDVDVQVRIAAEGAESRIERRVHLSGELSDAERARLLEIAGKCPVHKLLTSHITIDSTLA